MKARQWGGWVPVVIFLLAASPGAVWPTQATPERLVEREVFREGWQAARRGDHNGMQQAIARLGDYPLKPYLEFELHRQRIHQVPERTMEQFLARYRGWSFEASLETAWLRSLGRRGEYAALLRHGRNSGDTDVRCHVLRARIERGETELLEADIERLWLVGRSQSDVCDPAFAWWRQRGNPSTELAWQRFRLAMDSGETGLARYLRRYLDSVHRDWADLWLKMATRPHSTLREARDWPDHDLARELVTSAIVHMARREWARAAGHWTSLQPRFSWPESDSHRISREIALFRAVAMDEGAVAAIDELPAEARDQQILEWRARAAMGHGDWEAVLESIQSMSMTEQARGRWRYWRGRALAELQRPEALVAFASLSSEANYYGFLAAARLGQELSLCEQPLSVQPDVQQRLMRDSEFERAVELFHVGLHHHARMTWNLVSRRLSQAELEQAALLAAAEEWHDRSIVALNQAGNRQAYPWRFPMAEKGRVMAESERYGVDPALVFGLMRAESAMQADALSSAGARGLLQLIPSTAQAVARRNSLDYNGAHSLMDPAYNIPLGIAHLAELQERFNGDWTRVAAAYNAGLNAVTRWLDERPVTDADVWMETLPFYETRDYVPRVLAFATIYEWQLERAPGVLASNALGRSAPVSSFVCPP